jgi:DNA uptake protein ComE-like DNA-binding protein
MKIGQFFYLHKSDRQVILALLTVGVVALLVIFLAGGNDGKNPIPSVSVPSDSVRQEHGDTVPPVYYRQEERSVERFAFDPNTADSTQLLRLGLQPWMVRNIYKYRAAGGVYRKKEDFARLYGLTVKQYRELEPYIQISADYQPASTLVPPREVYERDTLRYPVKLTENETIELAQADTSLLKRVPGIGSYYARRIVEYGERLGGYVSVDQLHEIENFPMESMVFFTLGTPVVRKLNINQLSLNELKRHPYINFYQARAIIDYRRQHGPVSSLDDLRLLPDFSGDAINRLRPYIEY